LNGLSRAIAEKPVIGQAQPGAAEYTGAPAKTKQHMVLSWVYFNGHARTT
jgi:hypothetical protein